jgi:glyoxylase-like metal-dependent hydrolase (beta-lactamase superfamily II)
MKVVIAAITAGLLGPIALATGAPITSQHIAPNFDLEQLAPNVYAFVSNNTTHDWEDGNATVVIGDDGVAVIDAPAAYLSKRHLAEIRKLTNKPIRYLINTHFHRDHLLGDYVYKDASASVLIVQQDYTAALADRRDPEAVDALKGDKGAALLQRLKDAAEKSVDAEGKPLSAYDLARAKRSYDEFVPVYRDAQAARYAPADITFGSTMTLKLGSTEVQLLHLAGHTLGDTVVWLPKERILVTGDLVVSPVPYGGPDHYEEWIASLDRLLEFDAVAIVPGHGEVQFSREYMVLERDMFQSLMDQAVSAVKHGASLEEFEKTLDLSSFEAKLVHGDPELQWGWDHYFFGKTNHALAIRAYRTVRGER